MSEQRRADSSARADGSHRGALRSSTLPFEPEPAGGGEARPRRARTSEAVGVLVVSDRSDLLAGLEGMLKALNARAVRASFGRNALGQLLGGDFAAVLIDVGTHHSGGFELAQSIRDDERLADIPVIFIGDSDTGQRQLQRGYELGAVDFLEQPVDAAALRSKLTTFVGLRRKLERLRIQERQRGEAERGEMERRHRAEIQESKARIAQLVSSAMDAIVTVSESGTVRSFNEAAERMFGRARVEVLGRSVSLLFPDELTWTPVDRATEGSAAIRRLTGLRASGERFPIEATGSRMALDGQAVLSLILRDVSEQRRAEDALRTQAALLATTTAKLMTLNAELNRRQAELQHAMNARSRFYASMSHELRTPINAIIGYGTLLVDDIYGPLNERQRQGLMRSNRAALHLLELVNDVLDLSKVEAGKIELSLQPVGFPAILEEIFVTVRTMEDVDESRLSLESDGHATIITDPRRVRQIVLNLISNAMRFGDGQPVVVSCRADAEGGVEVCVSDSGPGIAASDTVRIFDEFVQLGGGADAGRERPGTGLGLAISRRLAELLGGSLDVDSVVGEGSVFRLRLPAVTELPDRGNSSDDGQTSPTM